MSITRYIDEGYTEAGFFEVIVNENIGTLTANPSDTVSASFTVTANVLIADTTGYYIDDYIAEGYYVSGETIEINETFLSSATITADVGVIYEIDADVDSTFTQTISIGNIKQGDCNMGALFTPNITADAFKNHDAILDTTTNLSATVTKFSGNEATLSNIVNLSLQGARSRDYQSSISGVFTQTADVNFTTTASANLSTQFTLTSNLSQQFDISIDGVFSNASLTLLPRILTRATQVEVYSGVNNSKTIDTVTTKFGNGSLKNVIGTSPGATISGAVHWTGSEYVFCDFNKTYKSSDGENWTAYSSNLNSSSRVYYSNNTFTSYKLDNGNNVIQYSTNGTSWSSQNLNTTFNQYSQYRFDTPFYFNNKWHLPYTLTVNNWRGGFYTSSTLTTALSNWSANATGITTNGASFFPRGAAFTSSKARMLYEQSNSDIQIVYSDNSGTSYATNTNMPISGTISNTSGFSIATDGTTTGVIQNTGTNTVVYYSSNLTGSWSSKTLSNVRGEAISYANGYWFVSTSKGLYSGTSISNLTLRYQPDAYYYSIVQNTVASDGTDFTTITSDYANKVLFSNDGTTFTDTNSISGASSPAILEYSLGNNSDYNSWKTIDFWYYPTTSTFANIGGQYYYSTNQYSDINYSFVQEGSNLIFRNQTNSLQGALTINQWNHVRMVNDNGNAALFIDGTRVDTDTISLQAPNTPFVLAPYFWRNTATNYLDEFLITDDLLTSPSTTSFSVPTTNYENDSSNIDLLLHFNNDFSDDSRFFVNPQASLTSQFNFVADVGGVFGFASLQASSGTLTADIEVTKIADADLTVQTTLEATATRIQQGEGSVDSETTVTVTPDVSRDIDATITSQASTSATATRIQQGVIDTDAVATQVTAAGRIGDFFINADLQASMTTDAVVKAGAVIAMDSAFSTLADTTLYKEFDSSVSSVFTQSISETLFKGFEGTQSSEFTTQADAVKTVDVDSTLDIISSVSATSLPIRNFDASVTSAFSQTVDNSRTRDFDTNSAIESTVTVDGIANVVGSAGITSTTAIVCDNSRIRDNEIDTDSVATQLSVAVKIADFFINADLQATLTSSPVKRTGNSALLESLSTIVTDGDVTRDAESDMSIATTVDAEGTSNLTGESSLDSEFTTQTDPIKTVDMNATLGGAGTFVVSAVATRNNEIQTSTTATMAIDVARIRDIQSNINSALTTVIIAGKQVDSASTVNTTATISADVRAIQLGLFEYVIPSETREETIVAEVREATVT